MIRTAAALALALALAAPAARADEPEPTATATDTAPGGRRTTEYVALRAGGGLGAAWLGAGGELSLGTLRWETFFWNLIRGGGYAAGAGDVTIAQVHVGTVMGFAVFRTPEEEARFGVGLNFGYGQGKHYDGVSGPGLMLDLTQVWHLDRTWSVQLSISLLALIPVAIEDEDDSFSMPLMPSLLVQLGFAYEG